MTFRARSSSYTIVVVGSLLVGDGMAMNSASERRVAVGLESSVAFEGGSVGLFGTVAVLDHLRVGALLSLEVEPQDRYEEECTPPRLAPECVRGGVLGVAVAELHPLKGWFDPYLGGLLGWANRRVQEHPRRNDLALGPAVGLDAHLGRVRTGLGVRYLFFPTLDANEPAQKDQWLAGVHWLARVSCDF